jgi:DNA-binding NarL/FixJ family response regulator
MVIRVVIVADSPIMQMGLETIIHPEPELMVIAAANQLDQLTELVPIEADVALLAIDLSEENLTTIVDWLNSDALAAVWLVEPLSEAGIAEALRLGVNGILANDATATDIVAALIAAAAGLVVVQPEIASLLISAPRLPLAPAQQALTQREIEVLRMLAEGMSNKRIAHQLYLSEHTVKFHISSIFAKLSVSSRTEAVTIGLRRGLILL